MYKRQDKTCTGFTLANATSGGKNTPDFIVGLRNSLVETGYMNPTDTNEGGWAGCARRTWCNDVFRMAIPESIRGIFKQFKWKQRNGGKNSSGLVETIDYFGLAPEKVVLGYRTYGFADEAALYTQWEWLSLIHSLRRSESKAAAEHAARKAELHRQMGVEPVSYTHLDVYKRQTWN